MVVGIGVVAVVGRIVVVGLAVVLLVLTCSSLAPLLT